MSKLALTPEAEILGCTMEQLSDVLAAHGYYDLSLGHAASDSPEDVYDSMRLECIATVDGLLRIFGITEQDWATKIISTDNEQLPTYNRKIAIAQQIAGVTAGNAAWGLGLQRLPIEDSDCGVGSSEVIFGANKVVIQVRTHGDFWDEHRYEDPNTGKLFWIGDASLEQSRWAEEECPDPIETESCYQLEVEARISTLYN